MNTFDSLGLSEKALAAVKQLGYTAPTPVQEQTIPLALKGRDVVAAAKTGTGKTAAFALPLIDLLSHPKQGKAPMALIVSPTRELAQQIADTCYKMSKSSGHYVLTVVGGTPYKPQISGLKRGVDILIATPGRLNDLMERGVVNLSKIEVLVLDEADRMLDMGFWPTMKKVIESCPKERQTLLFSATIDRKVMKSVEGILNNPAFVEVSHKGETADTVDQFIMPIEQRSKPELLRAVLNEKGSERIIVFTRTKSRSDVCTQFLRNEGFDAESIHSDKSQSERRRALNNFSRGKTSILVATDVLARGIDVSDVKHVINYDLPDCPEDYVHRIGRTGRAGEKGFAISFVSSDTKSALRDIERLIGQKIPFMGLDSYALDKGALDSKPGNRGKRKPYSKSFSKSSSGGSDKPFSKSASNGNGEKRFSKSAPKASGEKQDSRPGKSKYAESASQGYKKNSGPKKPHRGQSANNKYKVQA